MYSTVRSGSDYFLTKEISVDGRISQRLERTHWGKGITWQGVVLTLTLPHFMNELSSRTFQWRQVWLQIEWFSLLLSHDLNLIHCFLDYSSVTSCQFIPWPHRIIIYYKFLWIICQLNEVRHRGQLCSNRILSGDQTPGFCCRSSESNHRHWAPQCCSACGRVGQFQVQGVQRSPACQTGMETGQQPSTAR